MGKKPRSNGTPPPRRSSLLGDLARCFGWGPTIAVVVVAGLALQLLPKGPSHHHPPRDAHHSPGPLKAALDHQLEEWRLAAKKAFYDPAVAEYQAKARKGRRKPASFPPVSPSPVEITLGPKRIRAAAGDRDVPPHPQYDGLADFKRFKIATGNDAPSSTTVFYLMRIEPVGDKPIRAVLGKVALRDREGKALYVQDWHFPMEGEPGRMPVLMPGRGAMYEVLAEQRRIDQHPRFRDLLYLPESEVTLEWTPYFVCYEDGTMAGDAHAAHAIDGEGLPVGGFSNGLPWIVHQQYPHEIPNATIHTIYRP